MHMLPLINVTQSGIRIWVWLEILVALLKVEGRTNFPEFCDEEGYMLSESSIESVFHPILEEIKDHRDRILSESIPSGLDAKDHYQCNHYFSRVAENQALENGLENSVINFVHRWLKFEVSKGKQPGLNMLENYVLVSNTRYLQLR